MLRNVFSSSLHWLGVCILFQAALSVFRFLQLCRPGRRKSRIKAVLRGGSKVCITGCTSGIGEALTFRIAEEFPRNDLILIGRDGSRLSALKSCLSNEGRSVTILTADLCKSNDIDETASILTTHRVELLINAAGQSYPKPMTWDEIDTALIERLLTLNLVAPMKLTRAVLPRMAAEKNGFIVFLGSMSVVSGEPMHSAYVSPKGGLRTLATSLQTEVRAMNISVQCWEPGFVDTKMIKRYREQFGVVSVSAFLRFAFRALEGASSLTPTVFSPHPLHQLIIWLTNCVPTFWLNRQRLTFRRRAALTSV